MKIAIAILILCVVMYALMIYANWWGKGKCDSVGGHWINLNWGKYCVDNNFNEIDLTNIK